MHTSQFQISGMLLQVRQCAGLLLKNKLRFQFSTLPEENIQYIHVQTHAGYGVQVLTFRRVCCKHWACNRPLCARQLEQSSLQWLFCRTSRTARSGGTSDYL